MSDNARKQCPYCEQDFSDSSNRRRHVKKQHPEEHAKAKANGGVDTPEIGFITIDEYREAYAAGTELDAVTDVPTVPAGDITEGETILWIGVPAEIVKRRTLTEGMVRMWLSESRWFDIPARTPVRRVKSGAERG